VIQNANPNEMTLRYRTRRDYCKCNRQVSKASVDNEIISMRRYSYDLSVLSLITIRLLDSAFASHPEFASHPTTMISSTQEYSIGSIH